MPKESQFFDEKTILSTPKPVHCSSMSAENQKELNSFLQQSTKPISLMDDSFGILSLENQDFSFTPRMSDAAALRQKETEKAYAILGKTSLSNPLKEIREITHIPSQYMKGSSFSDNSVSQNLHSESTISESDLLLPGNSSTPRGSLAQYEFCMKERQSMGQSITSLVNSLHNPGLDLDKVLEDFRKTVEIDCSFQSGENAIAKLVQDELSWQKEKDIPAQINEFSVRSGDFKISMGSFFKEKSDNLSQLLAKSPEKRYPPVPLIETSSINQNSPPNTVEETDESMSLSKIQKIISSEQTTTSALDDLLKPKRKSEAKTSLKNFQIHIETPEKDNSINSINEEIKENISPETEKSMSSRSSSSLSSLPNGKLPIATTKTEIIWGCIKPGKNNCQEFILRNRSASRLGVKCSVCNPSFRLNKEGSELNFSSVIKIVLHPYESRQLCVTFAPTSIGAAVDNINFTPIDPNHTQTVKQFIRLSGYGGFGDITIHKIIKDTTGKFLLSLGNIEEMQDLKQTFLLKNYGTLPSFAYFNFVFNGLYSFSSIEVFPLVSVLLPGEEREVTVTYSVSRKDFAYIKSKINSPVIDLGKLLLIHGTEVDRARLRRICQKAKEKNHEVKASVLNLVEKFPGEVLPNDLKHFKETTSSIEELCKLFNREEITVTLEQDVDHTVTGELQDETAMFHSLFENTILDSSTFRETCHVEPTRIILTPPDKIRDLIFLTNNNKKKLYFEINSTPEGLNLKPRDGTINPSQTLMIELYYTPRCLDKTVFKVKILVDNESFEVDVKVLYVCKT